MGLLLNDGREREERRGEARDERELTPSRVCSHPHVRNPDKSSDIPLVVSFGGGVRFGRITARKLNFAVGCR